MLSNNKRVLFVLFMLFVPVLVLFADPPFKAGVAKMGITPTESIWLAGYAARKEPSNGVLLDIQAKALTLQDRENHRMVLVTTDLLGLPDEISREVAKRISDETGLDRSSLMLTSSHTHSAPVLRSSLETMYGLSPEQWNQITEYTEHLKEKLVQLIEASMNNLQPVSLYRGCGSADFGVNRREYTLDGVKIGVNPIGPVDPDVPVMKVVDEKGELLAIVFGYACHNTTLDINQISGDYAGFAQAYLEEHWPNAAAMFFIGCAGDINPNPRRTVELAKLHGRELSVAVEKVLTGPMREIKGLIRTVWKVADIPLTPPPTREQIQTQQQDPNIYIQQRAKHLLEILDRDGKIPDTHPYPIQLWSIGEDFLWLALSGEPVVDYSLLMKHKYGRDRIWVTGYANDVFAYIPSLRVLREGGYEADDSMIYYGLPGPWDIHIEETIVRTVEEMLKQIQL